MIVNKKIAGAVLKADFSMGVENYIHTRDISYKLILHSTPEVLQLKPEQITSFIECAGESISTLYRKGVRFDHARYTCDLESNTNFARNTRSRIFFDNTRKTVDSELVMLFIAILGLYQALCDDDDFWELYGLNGRYLDLTDGFEKVFREECTTPLYDVTMRTYDNAISMALHGVYSLAVTIMGEEEFDWHLQTFFEYATGEMEDFASLLADHHGPIGQC